MRRAALLSSLLFALTACGDETLADPTEPVRLESNEASVVVDLEPFAIHVFDEKGTEILTSLSGASKEAYGGPSATIDDPYTPLQILPGWDGYRQNVKPWRSGTSAEARDVTSASATFDVRGEGVDLALSIAVEGARVRLSLEAEADPKAGDQVPLNKSSIAFDLPADEHFFGLGERYASVDHRGLSIYSWAEEGGLGAGEGRAPGPENPYPNGPSMTYFPVPFFLSNKGYGVHLATTYRSEVHFGSERDDAFRLAVNANAFDAVIYVHADPLATISDYTEDTGRPPVPTPWVFGPRRRSGSGTLVEGVEEWRLMRQRGIAVTGIDDAVHFLPALSQLGREEELAAWTETLHTFGYKAMAYNNPYVAQDRDSARADYEFGEERGYFVKGPSGKPMLTQFISGELLTLATIDLTNPDAFDWFKSLLKRTIDLGYDGWMHDFGEYIHRDAVLHDGRRGDEFHNAFPVLSAKAAHDLLEKERPNDYLFFVRSGGSGTQKYVPAVWCGDAEATFDDVQGLPSAVRGGLNLSMTGVPYWGSDMTGFKCITPDPNDKEMFLRWVEFGAVSPIMMEQNACANPVTGSKQKWTLWSDEETPEVYARYASLHTRLQPYFLVLAEEAHRSGRPLTLHPFLLHPTEERSLTIDDAYYLGPSLYVAPVVARGARQKKTWLPPGRFVDFDDYTVHEGGRDVTIAAPLDKLPLFLTENSVLPLLDPSIDTLAPATDASVVTLDRVADRLDVVVVLGRNGAATMTLADGTELEASWSGAGDAPRGFEQVNAGDIAACASCYVRGPAGDVDRIRVNSALGAGSSIEAFGITLSVKKSPQRRIRWDVLKLP
jgi:sulfoquinovosidase